MFLKNLSFFKIPFARLMSPKTYKLLIFILGVLMTLGGLIRIFANQMLFELFFMGQLWSQDPYFIYIYKVLGAFVSFTGASFIVVSFNISKFQSLLKTWSIMFLFIGVVMIFAGFLSGIPLFFFLPDFLFCFLVAILLFVLQHIHKNTKDH